MKLYEIILRKIGLMGDVQTSVPTTPQISIYNPIECKVGGVVKVDSLDFRDYRFKVKEILEYSVSIGGDKHRMVDYVLSDTKSDFTCRLRIAPDPNSKNVVTYRAMLLTLYDEFGYNEDLHAVVKDDTKKFIIDDDTDPNNIIHDEFWRVNDVGISYKSHVRKLDIDTNIEEQEVEFWDYSRLTNVEGVEIEEFVIVEMDDAGYFSIWRGSEVNPERIIVV